MAKVLSVQLGDVSSNPSILCKSWAQQSTSVTPTLLHRVARRGQEDLQKHMAHGSTSLAADTIETNKRGVLSQTRWTDRTGTQGGPLTSTGMLWHTKDPF